MRIINITHTHIQFNYIVWQVDEFSFEVCVMLDSAKEEENCISLCSSFYALFKLDNEATSSDQAVWRATKQQKSRIISIAVELCPHTLERARARAIR